MQKPVRVSFQGLDKVDEIETACLKEAERLERYYDRMTSCSVVVAVPHRHKTKGRKYEVRIDMSVPGQELAVTRVPPEHDEEPLEVAVHEAFKTARRRLEDYVSKRADREKRSAS